MTVFPSYNANSPLPALDALPLEATTAFITRSSLDMATAALETVQTPASITRVAWLAPTISMALSLYVQNAQPGENRATARQRIEAALVRGGNDTLSLKGLGLLQLPPVIPNVRSLDLSDNRLSTLPPLPCDIQHLNVSGNRLNALAAPLPPRLATLDVYNNNLESLPDTLPSRLVRLNASNNGLRELPENLPRELRVLNVAANRVDLTQAAASRLNSHKARRIFDTTMGMPGTVTSQVRNNLDARRCQANLHASMVRIVLTKV